MGSQDILSTGWEEWTKSSPTSQMRPLPNQARLLCITLFGAQVDAISAPPSEKEEHEPLGPSDVKEADRAAKWNALPRELKLAISRIHQNLGHARVPDMLRALRISRASETAIKACRLFRCKECPRLLEPKIPRPSKLPQVDEFNVQIGMDVLEEKDSDNQSWSWLNVVCQGTGFQVCTLLGKTVKNPTSAQVLEAFETGWGNWAGVPEHGLIVDRARYFIGSLAEQLTNEGCHFTVAAKASPWQLGMIERAGGSWKSMFRRVVWSLQLSGLEDILLATAAINQARNSLARRSGFSPQQWVLGRSLRLPADLMDDGEVARVGAQAAAETPGTRFYRKSQVRFAAREAFMKTQHDDVLRRAELRRVRPTRGPFKVGDFVFYYDQADQQPGPNHWRGIARVIGHEGNSTVWITHRGMMIAVSPEHLAHANQDEVQGWLITSNEMSLIDAMPGAGGAGFLDLRQRPVPPPEGFADPEGVEDEKMEPRKDDDGEMSEGYQPTSKAPSVDLFDEENPNAQAGDAKGREASEDLSASSTSMARMQLESERERKRELRSGEFFQRQQDKRQRLSRRRPSATSTLPLPPVREGLDVPVGPSFDPELEPDLGAPPLPAPMGVDDVEAVERASKRLRMGEANTGSAPGGSEQASFCFLAYESEEFLLETSRAYYNSKKPLYESAGIDEDVFLFGCERNDFSSCYEQLLENAMALQEAAPKKKARKEIKLPELDEATKQLFTMTGGSDEKEWKAWLDKGACEIIGFEESQRILKERPDQVIPTRWVRTNKSDGKPDEEFFAKSRLVVQGFKDRSLGSFRRDAPTASALAESVCLTLAASFQFVMVCKDIKNAYFSGKDLGRELYLLPPRGGLKGVRHGQLLKAKKAIYGFSEAARLFWLALKEHLEKDGWKESRLEPALFYYHVDGVLKGILCTHVDDIQAGVEASFMSRAFRHSSNALEFAKSEFKKYTFRGHEVAQHDEGIDVTMSNYARSMKPVKIDKQRKTQLEARLTDAEKSQLESAAGELGWIVRQLRCDLAYENGCIQRCKKDPCVADLVRLRQAVAAVRRAADFRQRFWQDVDPHRAVLVHLADSGHANGVPDNDEILKYRSIGGYLLFLANPEILDGSEAHANLLSFHSTQTKRVCRSTLAAEAAHLAEAVEAGDWVAVLLAEALEEHINLKEWDKIVEQRTRIYVTDARSVYDYLQKESSSTSSDKRMAIEGALLRETVRRPAAHFRWIDGEQNIADILTKANTDKTSLFEYLRDGKLCLVQTERNRKSKEKKREQRKSRKVVKDQSGKREAERDARIKKVASEMKQIGSSSEDAHYAKVNKR